MSRFCKHPDCSITPLESDADILLHILEHQIRNETAMALIFDNLNAATTKLTDTAASVASELSNSTEPADQASIDAATSRINDAVTTLNAALPAPPVAAPVVDPTTGLLPDGSTPTA